LIDEAALRRLERTTTMDLHLSGQTAIVTGASRGIGLAVTRGLIAEGVSVIAAARKSSAELDDLARTGLLRAVEVDLAEPSGPSRLVADSGDRIDILVNNVGSAPARPGGFGEITDEDWEASLTVNLMAAVRTTRAVLPAMLAAGKGAIVNVSSANAFLPDPAVMDYSAAKAALASFSKSLSKEVGGHGVRVNTVSPGPVATDLWLGESGVAATVSRATGARPEDVQGKAARQMVTGRFSRPEEVADLVVILASDRTANVTGANITIDGGLIPTW
jgi:NAD(P)-dependent dehydrogenase (short-subunit alcohol dehydrogenase family)